MRELADVRAAVPPVPRAARPGLPAARRRLRVGWVIPVSAAVVVVLLVLIPRFQPSPAPPAAGQGVTLPSSLAGFSFLTGDLAQAPIGRAVAVYHERSETFEDYMDWHTAILDADGDRYRHVGTLAGVHDQLLLSPDGRFLAGRSGSAALTLVDIATATVTTHTLADEARLLAWSPDGRRLAYVFGGVGQLMYFDTETGESAAAPGITGVTEAAFSPDGSQIAVQIGPELVFFTRTSEEDRRFAIPADLRLLSGVAWSPEGRRLAMHRMVDQIPSGIAFIDAGTGESAGLADISDTMMEGWRTSGSVVTRQAAGLVEVPINGGAATTLVAIRHNVATIKLATGLLAGANVRTPAAADRGPWPQWAQIALVVILVVLIAPPLAFIVLRRRARRRLSANRAPS